jgi:transcriptional regulator with XRE-family HTH domain
MAKPSNRVHSRVTHQAAALLGKQIRIARKERKMTAQDLADRAGISRGLLRRIEAGNLNCQIGAVFEAAALVGLRFFDADESTLASKNRQADDKLALLPKHVQGGRKDVDDDF